MKRNYFIIYSATLSVVSFAVAFVLSAATRETRRTIHAMIGDKPLPWFTTISLSTPPVFYLLAAAFLALAVTSLLRPALVDALLHVLIITLIAEAAVVFVALGGVAFFFVGLDFAMSSTPK